MLGHTIWIALQVQGIETLQHKKDTLLKIYHLRGITSPPAFPCLHSFLTHFPSGILAAAESLNNRTLIHFHPVLVFL